ncbi:family 43 glycosylhydrolase [Paenibacillus anseongense]|uniref:glucosamine inositolphosphorylceramide transferase family protein n=1 Tax=Paenibacillus TaxID=44249 RepID=UPI002DBB24BB|nr:family 43 glycosylhydrolase [Paenibacillus anseongense]MEC0266401.1 family 43 glycosylhydrolase [Paenibacillus anseongense]
MNLNKKIELAVWSIKIIKSDTIFPKRAKALDLTYPTLQCTDVTDVEAEFVADPFVVSDGSNYYVFFEVLNKHSERGEIAVAVSTDGEKWQYDRVVLKESFHLSYPNVFTYENDYYMLPESSEAGGVFLYKSMQFPYNWERKKQLLSGPFVDPTLFYHNQKWWMFVGSKDGRNLYLFYADRMDGEWVEHPCNPIIKNDLHISRPAGKVVAHDGEMYRFTQDGVPSYGKMVRAARITKLSETEYEEEVIEPGLLTGSGQEQSWRKDGMHHIDHLQTKDNKWMIAVDGHFLKEQNYLVWKTTRFMNRPFYSSYKLSRTIIKKLQLIAQLWL